MSTKTKVLIAALAVVVLAVAGAGVWLFFVREREGIHDERINNPSISDIASFEGCLVHSADEFDAGDLHLTAWYVVKKPDGSYVRQWVATVAAWNRLAKGGARVIQLSEAWMGEHLPVEGRIDS